MNLDELKLPSARDDFAAEIVKYHAKQPYEAGHIVEYMAIAYAQFVTASENGVSQGSTYSFHQAMRLGLKPLVQYVNECEAKETSYKATYVAALNQRKELESALTFWKTIATALASITVAWAVFRTVFYLWPVIEPALTELGRQL